MRNRRFQDFSIVTACVMLTSVACSHREVPAGPSTGPSGGTGTGPLGGSTSSSGGSTTSSGASPGSGGSGTAAGPGAGGSSVSNGGTPGGGNGSGNAPGDGGATATKMSCVDRVYSDKYTPGYTPDPAVIARVQTLVNNTLTLAQKADQLRGTPTSGGNNYSDIFRTPDSGGVKGFLFRDGPRGVNLASQLPAGKTGYSTAFPVSIARGAAFDLDLEYRIGVAHGDETVASGNTMMLAPTINVLRHPLWGRTQETYGEDPFLLGRMGSAYTVGVQEFVPACAKHYAANNIEVGRSNSNATMDEQTLREVYGRHFEMVIREGGVACVMASYNLVNGSHATQNAHLLTDVLRTDFGFRGFVLSDWWAMPPGQNAMAGADTLKANAAQAIKAGMEIELPWSLNYQHIESITGQGLPLAVNDINQAASRVLEQKFRFKVGDPSQPIGLKRPTTTLSPQGAIENNAAHVDLAYEAALKSMVLLKNENATLPIKQGLATVAVVGANVPYMVTQTDMPTGTISFATAIRTGDLGSSRVFADPAKSIGPFDGIKAAAGGVNVVSGADASVAQTADFVVVVVGLTPQDEGEEYTGAGDRTTFALDAKVGTKAQDALVNAVVALKKPMVVVIEAGSIIDMPWLGQVPAVVMGWYPGMVGGKALGELLFGSKNFSGKLPITWPATLSQLPAFNPGTTVQMDYYLGYRLFDKNAISPLFPFGHGLSYTKFDYANLQVPCSDVTKAGVVDVKVDVTNSGTVAGDEVVFLFVSYPATTARRPIKELKGFQRVSLEPGTSKQVVIPLRVADLKYWDMATSRWTIENGPVQIQVGSSAASLPLKDTVTVK